MDHRQRVAAECREQMRDRLLASSMTPIASKGMGDASIDDVIATAEVSRGTFYRYCILPEAVFQDLAVEIANELISIHEARIKRLQLVN